MWRELRLINISDNTIPVIKNFLNFYLSTRFGAISRTVPSSFSGLATIARFFLPAQVVKELSVTAQTVVVERVEVVVETKNKRPALLLAGPLT